MKKGQGISGLALLDYQCFLSRYTYGMPKDRPLTEQTSPMKSPIAIIVPCSASQPISRFRLHYDCVHKLLNGITGIVKGKVPCVLIGVASLARPSGKQMGRCFRFAALPIVCSISRSGA